ncbi:MAG: hypothetical protein QNI92_07340 [Desulfobacterales bacterium]|nr:hypothetical protein [Desulfobacterales bacterium]
MTRFKVIDGGANDQRPTEYKPPREHIGLPSKRSVPQETNDLIVGSILAAVELLKEHRDACELILVTPRYKQHRHCIKFADSLNETIPIVATALDDLRYLGIDFPANPVGIKPPSFMGEVSPFGQGEFTSKKIIKRLHEIAALVRWWPMLPRSKKRIRSNSRGPRHQYRFILPDLKYISDSLMASLVYSGI